MQIIETIIPGDDFNVLKEIILVLYKLVLIGTLFALFTYLYDNFLWKLFFPRYNISGTWKYSNSYADNREGTMGKVIIKQTPYKVTFVEGSNGPKNLYPSSYKSTSVNFNEDTLRLVVSYVVKKYKNEEPSKFIKKRSVLELEVMAHKNGPFSRAITMEGYFYNCVQSPTQEFLAAKYKLGDWPMTWGTSVYVYEKNYGWVTRLFKFLKRAQSKKESGNNEEKQEPADRASARTPGII